MEPIDIPLFPLHSVLLPGGVLALRIFEARYLQMISDCMKQQCGFGVVQIRSGEEVGATAEVYPVGTLSHIVDWYQEPDGVLGVTVEGSQRVRLLEQSQERSGLQRASVELIANDPPSNLPDNHRPLAQLLEQLLARLDRPYNRVPRHYQDAGWVGSRLTELLPLESQQRQLLLESNTPLERLDRLQTLLAIAD